MLEYRWFYAVRNGLCGALILAAPLGAQYRIEKVAGNPSLFNGVTATNVPLRTVESVAVDGRGGYYIAELGRLRIRHVDAQGTLRTVAGSGISGPSVDGARALDSPLADVVALAMAPSGELYFAEKVRCRISRLDAGGTLHHVAGIGTCGFAGDGGPALGARIDRPEGLTFDPQGRLLIADTGNHRIRRVNVDGTIATIAGTGNFQPFTPDGASALLTNTYGPVGLAVGTDGVIYFAESGNFRVRKIAIDGRVATVAGNGNGNSGDGGSALQARFGTVRNFALDTNRNRLFIADTFQGQLRQVDLASGLVSHVAGYLTIPYGVDGGPAQNARLRAPTSVSIDSAGAVYLAERDTGRIRKIDAAGVIRTVAGRFPNTENGAAGQAELFAPNALAIDGAGGLLISDSGNHIIRRVANESISILAGIPDEKLPPNFFGNSRGDGGPATEAGFFLVTTIAIDAARLFLLDGSALRRIEGGRIFGVGSAAQPVRSISEPLVVDGRHNRLFAVADFNKVVVADLGAAVPLFLDFAGNGTTAFGGDGGPATAAGVVLPKDMAVDSAGNVYIAEFGRIRVVSAAEGTIRTVAGNGRAPATLLTGADVAPLAGSIAPVSIAIDDLGRVVMAEGSASSAIRVYDPALNRIYGIAGGSERGFSGDGGPALAARINSATVVRTGPDGSIYFVEGVEQVVRVLRPEGRGGTARPVIRPQGVTTASGFGGDETIAPGTWIEIFGTNFSATTRSWAADDFQGAQAPIVRDGVRVSINGRAAYVAYVSPGQINAQVPDGIAAGTANVIVANAAGASAPVAVTVADAAPALLAPSAFAVGGVQYAAAIHQDGTFVGREGLIAGVPFRPAKPGDVLTLFGVGFGATRPATPSGQIAGSPAPVENVRVRFGELDASVLFAGLAPGAVGLYQVNIVAPAAVAGDVPLTLSAGGRTSQQNLRLTMGGN